MKAAICEKIGQKLLIKEVELPKLGEKQVLIETKACGINFPDLLMINGKYQFQPEMPFTAGGEVAGRVVAVGEKVQKIKVGDRVFAGVRYGAFAEKVISEEFRTFPIPTNIDFRTAAGISTNYGTALYALLERANLQKDDTLLVTGASGGVGMASIQLGKILGKKVIAIGSNDEKLALCQKNGADFCLNFQKEDIKNRLKEITEGKGIDVILDLVGGDLSEILLRNMARNGRFLVTGFASGAIPKIALNLVLLKSCQIIGVFWTDFVLNNPQKNELIFEKIIEFLEKGQIKPHIYQVLAFEKINEALGIIQNREVIGKVIIEF